MSLIKQVRAAIRAREASPHGGEMQETAKLLQEAKGPHVRIVHTDTEDHGDRWTEWESTVWLVMEGQEVAYFKALEEKGRTEGISGSGVEVCEVIPKEVTVVQYRELTQKEREQWA